MPHYGTPGAPLLLDDGDWDAKNVYHGQWCVVCYAMPTALYVYKDRYEMFVCDNCFDVFDIQKIVGAPLRNLGEPLR
jgi:hypothetical protein